MKIIKGLRSPVGKLHPRFLKPETGRIGPAAGRDENMLRRERFRTALALDGQFDAILNSFDGPIGEPGQNRDPVVC